jgi:hypothetical protein
MNRGRYCSATEAAELIRCKEADLLARAALGLISGSQLDRYGWRFRIEVVQKLAAEGLPEVTSR